MMAGRVERPLGPRPQRQLGGMTNRESRLPRLASGAGMGRDRSRYQARMVKPNPDALLKRS